MTDSNKTSQAEEPQRDDCSAPGCPCCNPVERNAAEIAADEAAINQDPATRSLNQALGLSFGMLKLIMLVILAFFVVRRFTYIEEGTIALKKRFGAYVTTSSEGKEGVVRVYKPGDWVFVLPAPIESLERLSAGREGQLTFDTAFWPKGAPRQIGSETEPKALDVRDTLEPGIDGYNLCGGGANEETINIVHSRWEIRFRVARPEEYAQAVAHELKAEVAEQVAAGLLNPLDLKPEDYLAPEDLLRAAAATVIIRNLAGADVDDILKSERSSQILDRIESELASEIERVPVYARLGLRVGKVSALAISPPGKVKPAFDEVTSALANKDAKIKDADSVRRTIEQETRAQVEQVRNQARVEKQRVVAKARADAEYLTSLVLASPLLEEADVLDWGALVTGLAKPETPGARRLAERLAKLGVKLPPAAPEAAGRTELLAGLRRLQTETGLYTPEAFPNLPAEATPFIKEAPFPKEGQMLGRLLLTAALPQAIRPLGRIYRSSEDLSIFLEQQHLRTVREVLEPATIHLVHPSERSVLITTPRYRPALAKENSK